MGIGLGTSWYGCGNVCHTVQNCTQESLGRSRWRGVIDEAQHQRQCQAVGMLVQSLLRELRHDGRKRVQHGEPPLLFTESSSLNV